MAGVVLLISKNNQNINEFSKKIERAEHFINRYLAQYFKNISIQNPNPDHFLIQFRKDDRKKYYALKDGSWIAFSGHVFALHETRILNVEELWDLYTKNGTNFANLLDGHFVIKVYDSPRRKFLVFNDFAKNRSEFLTETDNYILFSPFLFLSALIKKPELDHYAFNEYMWRYYILSDRTMLKGTSRFTPATMYEVQNGVLKSKRYWNWPEKYSSLKFPDAVEKLSESMKESAHLVSKFDVEPVIEFTMGQDSRQIVSAFTNQNLPFTSAIYGKDTFYEVQNVKEMTARHGIKNIHIKLSEDYSNNPFPYFKKGILLSNMEEPGHLIGRILHMKSLYRPTSSLLLNGVHGRYYKDGLWNEIYVFNLYREPSSLDIDKLLKYRIMNKNYDNKIFADHYQEIKSQSSDYFASLIRDCVKDRSNSPISIQLDKFDAEHYSNFGMMANTACDFIIDLLSPLLLRRNLESALEFPVRWKCNLSNIQRAVVDNLDSDLAKEITDFSEITMSPKSGLSHMLFLSRYWYAQSKKLRDKFKNKFGFHVTTPIQKAWDYVPIYSLIAKDEETMNMLNYNSMVLSEILDKNSWTNYIENFYGGNGLSIDQYEYLLKISSVELFLKLCQEI